MRFLWLPLSFPCSSFHMDACVLFFWQSKIKIVFILKWDWVICILTKKEQVNNCIPAHRITGASWPWKTTNYYLNSIKYCIFPRGTSDPQTNVKSLLLFVHCWLFKNISSLQHSHVFYRLAQMCQCPSSHCLFSIFYFRHLSLIQIHICFSLIT